MALTLTAALGVPTTLNQAIRLTITGTVPAAIVPGYQFRLEDEVLELRYFGKTQETALGGAATQTVDDRNVWYAQRGVAGTVIASHALGTAVVGLADALAVGDDEDVPEPFAGGGGTTDHTALDNRDAAESHDAAAVSYDPAIAGLLLATEVQGAIDESLGLAPTSDQKSAMDLAATPDASNPFATMADLPATPTLQQAITASPIAEGTLVTNVDSSGVDALDAVGTRTFTHGAGVTKLNSNGSIEVNGTFVGTTIRNGAGGAAPDPTLYELPIAVDYTAGTGGLYTWNGDTWIKISDIPTNNMRVTVHLEAADILTLFSSPFTVVPAPGAGKWLRFLHLGWEWKLGTATYQSTAPGLIYGDDFMGGEIFLETVDLTGASRTGVRVVPAVLTWLRTAVENKPIVLGVEADAIFYHGGIVTSTLADGGSGYAPGDTGTVTANEGGTDATYVVDTVDGGGEVATYHLATPGAAGWAVDVASTAVTTGGGDGLFTINVTEITPADGDLYVTIDYTIEDLH